MTTAIDLLNAVTERLRIYWRMRLAIRIANDPEHVNHGDVVKFERATTTPLLGNLLNIENVGQSMIELQQWADERLESETLMLLISIVEQFLSEKLVAKGRAGEGTLGQLQHEAQNLYSIAGVVVVLFDEIRERRNAVVHHAGRAHSRHVIASQIASRHSSLVKPTTLGDNVRPKPDYLTHAADTLAQYAAKFT